MAHAEPKGADMAKLKTCPDCGVAYKLWTDPTQQPVYCPFCGTEDLLVELVVEEDEDDRDFDAEDEEDEDEWN